MRKANTSASENVQVVVPPRIRKKPRQQRSALLVTSIKLAAKEIIDTNGRNGLTISKLSTWAGVSVSSIYEYYPSIDSIVAEVFSEYHRDVIVETREKLRSLPSAATLYDALLLLFRAPLTLHQKLLRIDAPLYRQWIFNQELNWLHLTPENNNPRFNVLRELFSRFDDEISVRDPDKARFLLFTIITAVNRALALEHLEYCDQTDTAAALAGMAHALLTGNDC